MKNVLKFYPLRKRYYLTHPWEFISQTWCNLRAAGERITKGFAARDTWDLDNYLLELLPNMIEHLKNNTNSHPGDFNTFEEWQNVLQKDIIIPLRNAQEKNAPTAVELVNIPYKNEDGAKNELWEDFFKRENESFKWRTSQLKLGLENLGEHFWSLWD